VIAVTDLTAQQRAQQPEAADLLAAVAAEFGLDLSYLAATTAVAGDCWSAQLRDPNPCWQGPVLRYQQWNNYFCGLGGRPLAGSEVRAYLAIYAGHREWSAEAMFAALRPEPGPAGFYVTVKDAGRTGWLLGPYDSKAEAEGKVTLGAKLAGQHDDRAHFYAYGVARLAMRPGQALPKGILNDVAAKVVTS
jgi:hypothetical protein